jgi:hypothetical protein
MKSLIKLTLVAFLITGLTGLPVNAQDMAESARKELIEKLKKDYPLTTCVVSDDKLGGEMGAPIDYLYEESGKPARLVRFCCKGCIKSFKKDPAKYLKMVDEASAKKTATPALQPDSSIPNEKY